MYNQIEHRPRNKVIQFINAFLVIVLINSSSICSFATNQSKKQRSTCSAGAVVELLYNDHFKRWKDSEEEKLNTKKKWLSAKLFDLFILKSQRPRNKNKVPYMDGDPFTHAQENPSTFRLGKTSCVGSQASVRVEFVYEGSLSESVIVKLLLENGEWVVNDIYYPGGHSLQHDLKRK